MTSPILAVPTNKVTSVPVPDMIQLMNRPEPKNGKCSAPIPEQELLQEKEWLAATLANPEKFHFFYDKYAGRIERFVGVRTGDVELARDLTARVFTLALSHLNDFQWQGFTLGSWLFRIATNEIRKYYARQAQLKTVAPDSPAQPLPDPHEGQLDSLILTEEQNFIFQCLHKLPLQDQDIFILYYWEGQKTREVADTLGLSENTVKTRLARGRRRLRKMMESPLKQAAAGPDPDLRFADWALPPKD